jgi:hypothetical protein
MGHRQQTGETAMVVHEGQRAAHAVSGSRAQRLRRQKLQVVWRGTTPTAYCVRGSLVRVGLRVWRDDAFHRSGAVYEPRTK